MYEAIALVLMAALFAYLYKTEEYMGALKFMWLILCVMTVLGATVLDTSLYMVSYYGNTITPGYTVVAVTTNVPLYCTGVPALNAVQPCGTTNETETTYYPRVIANTNNTQSYYYAVTNRLSPVTVYLGIMILIIVMYLIWRALKTTGEIFGMRF
jgi:hypothetical protein